MDTVTPKVLGAPIPGEDQGAMVACPLGHVYGLYGHGIRNDFCRVCETKKAKAGDRPAQKQLWKLSNLRRKAKQASQREAERAQQSAARGPRAARWEPWEQVSPKGYVMGTDFSRPTGRRAE